MKLYIGNCTKQRREWYFRIPGEKLKQMHEKLDIEPGRQAVLPYDLSSQQMDLVIENFCGLGFINVKEVSRNHNFVGMIYSIDKPISENALSYTLESNDGKLDENAIEELRKNASAGMLNLGNQPRGEPQLQQIDTLVESEKDARDVNQEQRMVADGVAVSQQPTRRRGRG